MIKGYLQNLPGLEQDIIKELHKLERRRLFFKQGIYELISIISFLSIIPATVYIVDSFSTSGIYEYISLIFTNIETLSYWKELSLSLLESIPFLGLAIGFGVLGIFLWSMVRALDAHRMKNAIA
jgi:hypothetical protein